MKATNVNEPNPEPLTAKGTTEGGKGRGMGSGAWVRGLKVAARLGWKGQKCSVPNKQEQTKKKGTRVQRGLRVCGKVCSADC